MAHSFVGSCLSFPDPERRPICSIHSLYISIRHSWPLLRTWRPYLSRHLLCSFCLQSFQCFVPLVFHYSPLLEICDLLPNQLAHVFNPKSHSFAAQFSRTIVGRETYPTRRTIRLKSSPLRRASLIRFLLLCDTIHNVVPVQTSKICISRLPAFCSLRSIRGYWCAI